MSFTVLLHPKAAKELEKIENTIKARIVERLRGLKDNPERVGKALRHSNFWSLKVGDYRAIYEIDRARRQVVVLFVGHRKKVYDDFSKLF
ncbi:MAG: type II toxin-antitoxin system RelE family toxin [Candidatus Bathyarchaeales archaeon]